MKRKDRNLYSSEVIKQKPVVWTNRGRFKLFIAFLLLFGPFVLFLKYSREEELKEIKFIESNYRLVKAKIVRKSTYKGWTLTVEYSINNKKYRESDGVTSNSLKVGDSIWIKYSKSNPDLINIDLN